MRSLSRVMKACQPARKNRAHSRTASTLVALTMAAGALSACGGSNADAGEQEGDMKLSIASCCAVSSLAQLYVASALGFFDEEGLTVEITETGANTVTSIVSGESDVAMASIAGGLGIAVEGKPVSVIQAWAGAGTPSLVSNPEITSPEQCTRIAGTAIGTSTYGGAVIYKELFDIDDAEVVPMADFPTIIASLSSDQIDCAAGIFSNYSARIESGDLNLLVDTRDLATREKYFAPLSRPEGALYGLTDTLEEKREAVVALLRGFDKANEWLKTASDEEVADALRESPGFANIPAEQLASDFPDTRPYMTYADDNAGHIPADTWPQSLDFYAAWGLDNVDPDDPKLAYEEIVDMSFLEDARK